MIKNIQMKGKKKEIKDLKQQQINLLSLIYINDER